MDGGPKFSLSGRLSPNLWSMRTNPLFHGDFLRHHRGGSIICHPWRHDWGITLPSPLGVSWGSPGPILETRPRPALEAPERGLTTHRP